MNMSQAQDMHTETIERRYQNKIQRALTCLVGNGVGPIEGDALGLTEGCRVDVSMDLNESEPT